MASHSRRAGESKERQKGGGGLREQRADLKGSVPALTAANVIQVLSSYRQRVMDHVPKQQAQARRAIRIEKVAAEEQTQLRQAQESRLLPALLCALVYAVMHRGILI